MNTIKMIFTLMLSIFLLANFTVGSAEMSSITDSNFVKTQHIVSDTGITFLVSDTLNVDTNNIANAKNDTFWEKYIEPAVTVIGAAAITLLLFGTRTKQ